MSGSIFVSDEYNWSAQTGLYEWVVEFLLEHVGDDDTRSALRESLDHQLGSVDLTGLSGNGRAQALRALREHLPAAADARWPDQPAVRGHVKVLALMAKDIFG